MIGRIYKVKWKLGEDQEKHTKLMVENYLEVLPIDDQQQQRNVSSYLEITKLIERGELKS